MAESVLSPTIEMDWKDRFAQGLILVGEINFIQRMFAEEKIFHKDAVSEIVERLFAIYDGYMIRPGIEGDLQTARECRLEESNLGQTDYQIHR